MVIVWVLYYKCERPKTQLCTYGTLLHSLTVREIKFRPLHPIILKYDNDFNPLTLFIKEFCDWVADLGGESNNIEESTITSLFASGWVPSWMKNYPVSSLAKILHLAQLTWFGILMTKISSGSNILKTTNFNFIFIKRQKLTTLFCWAFTDKNLLSFHFFAIFLSFSKQFITM